MTIKYLRVVLAVKEEDLPLVDGVLEMVIEADNQVDGWPYMGVQGAYVSAPYDDRESALEGPFVNMPLNTDASEDDYLDKVTEAVIQLDAALYKFYQEHAVETD